MAERRKRSKRQIDEFFIPVKKTQTCQTGNNDEQAFENTDVNNNDAHNKDGRSTPTNVDQPGPALTLSTNVRPNQTNVNVVTLSNRTTRREWFTRFPWLKMEQKENNDQKLFLCNFCISAGRKNIFTTGKLTNNPKTDDFVKHEKTVDHKFAVTAKLSAENREMPQSAGKAFSKLKEAIIATMRTVYFIGKQDLAKDKISDLQEFCLLQVSQLNCEVNPNKCFWNFELS